jgi:hypothetical protein
MRGICHGTSLVGRATTRQSGLERYRGAGLRPSLAGGPGWAQPRSG